MPRYKLTIEYDGTPYAGWQRQVGQPTVQQAMEEAASKFANTPVTLVGAGRTDAGVHAIMQVVHVDLPKELDPFRVMQGINYYLFNPEGDGKEEADPEALPENRIAVTAAEQVSDEFHARFTATKRRYLYRIINRRSRLGLEAGRAWHVIDPLDHEAMHAAAQWLLGTHDFTSFRDSECQAKSPVKTLEQLDVRRMKDEVHIIANARSFLHHQMRIMAGTLGLIGRGKWKPEDILTALDAKDRAKAGPTAPPGGLYLIGVEY